MRPRDLLGGPGSPRGLKGASRGSLGAIGLVWWFMRHICLYISDPDFYCRQMYVPWGPHGPIMASPFPPSSLLKAHRFPLLSPQSWISIWNISHCQRIVFQWWLTTPLTPKLWCSHKEPIDLPESLDFLSIPFIRISSCSLTLSLMWFVLFGCRRVSFPEI